MNDELTAQDIAMMQKELNHRKLELMPELIEEVKRTRAFGDLSENFEYKAAKQAQNRNRSRIRYLERMIKSARVIEDRAAADEVGLFDKVELYFEEDDETETIQVVTTVRCDPLQGRISREAPLGKALLGRKQGDRVSVMTEDGDTYTVVIRSICKQADDGTGSIL
ncbi:GreA/GreB family elongation factor [Candidatus Agathobaculum pullicola]|uniref:GreA/GreB family elongation factor n=1 Tax=Candidatus Agathobaculum pullicola TaxID=2838426 RepID=UPI003F903D8E